MQRNLNMNVSLRQGGRSAMVMSTSELETRLRLAYDDNNGEMSHSNAFWLEEILTFLIWNDDQIQKDMKVEFDTENISGEIRSTLFGVPYVLIEAGGDWQLPVISMLYSDGKRWRLYIPTKGNLFNPKTKQAIGNDEDADWEFLRKELNLDGLTEEEAHAVIDELTPNVEACIEDFESRLTLKAVSPCV